MISVCPISQLRDLNLGNTKITAEGLAELGDHKLNSLSLEDMPQIGDEALRPSAPRPA